MQNQTHNSIGEPPNEIPADRSDQPVSSPNLGENPVEITSSELKKISFKKDPIDSAYELDFARVGTDGAKYSAGLFINKIGISSVALHVVLVGNNESVTGVLTLAEEFRLVETIVNEFENRGFSEAEVGIDDNVDGEGDSTLIDIIVVTDTHSYADVISRVEELILAILGAFAELTDAIHKMIDRKIIELESNLKKSSTATTKKKGKKIRS